ncbi:MAG TPA: tetratricopeptide repeat protein [Symbiobacteriaceae bacterium]|nr:tetratricopeptide repeat protein [Symbiobacteriaceae bacterium]
MADFDQLWDYSRPEQTEQAFRHLLPAAEQGSDRSYHAELLTQIARCLGLQGRFAEGHALLDQVEGMLEAGLTPVPRLRYLLERGRVFRSSGQPALAIPLFLEAWNLGRDTGEDDLATDAAHMLGITESEPASQMEWNLRALDLAERSPKARRWCGSLYNNIGWAFADAGQLQQALDMFQRAVQFRAEQGAPVPLRTAKWCVGKMLRLLHRTEEALALQQELCKQVDPAAGEDGFILEEIAECLLQLDRGAEAQPWFAQAYRYLSQERWLVQQEPDRIRRLHELGGLHS